MPTGDAHRHGAAGSLKRLTDKRPVAGALAKCFTMSQSHRLAAPTIRS
jgi:hypothetical protein